AGGGAYGDALAGVAELLEDSDGGVGAESDDADAGVFDAGGDDAGDAVVEVEDGAAGGAGAAGELSLEDGFVEFAGVDVGNHAGGEAPDAAGAVADGGDPASDLEFGESGQGQGGRLGKGNLEEGQVDVVAGALEDFGFETAAVAQDD